MRSVLSLTPTSNFAVASPGERSDATESLARVLMGLSHPIQIIGQSRTTTTEYDWPSPPRLSRQWLAVVTADENGALKWRTDRLKAALEGVGLRAVEWTPSHIEEAAGSGQRPMGSPSKPGWKRWLAPGATENGVTNRAVPVAGTGVIPGLSPQVLPDAVRISDDEWAATLVLRRWPREVAPGWLGQALAVDLPVDVAIHVVPQDAQKVARWLKGQKDWQDDGGKDAANALGARDAAVTRQRLIARTDRPVKVAVALTVRAPDRYQLAHHVATLQHLITTSLGDARLALFEQDRGLEATTPMGVCRLLGAYRTLDCASVASTWPFQPATINHSNGADIGTTHEGSMLVRLDPFDPSLRSFGGLLTGSVGSGKSYFLKLLLRRLRGVELRIVEHSDPPEYEGVPNLLTFNVADMSEADQATKLREYITDLWVMARRDPKPRLLVLDELWSVLKRPELAKLVEEVARRGRKYGLALWIATQQVEELLANEWGKAVFDNAKIRVYLQQENRDLEGLCQAAHLPVPARKLLRGAARGQALIDCDKMLVLCDVQAAPEEHRLVTTDPREVWGLSNAAD